MLGREHPDTLTSMNNLASVLNSQGKYVQSGEELLGPKHSSTLTSMSNLAGILANQGRNEEAEEMHPRALELYDNLQGKGATIHADEHEQTCVGAGRTGQV
jgi:hypothetical protein